MFQKAAKTIDAKYYWEKSKTQNQDPGDLVSQTFEWLKYHNFVPNAS